MTDYVKLVASLRARADDLDRTHGGMTYYGLGQAETDREAAAAIEAQAAEIERLRAELARAQEALRALEKHYAAKVVRMEAMKERGDLTKDWGECSLVSARITLSEISAISAALSPALSPDPGSGREAGVVSRPDTLERETE